MHLFLASIVRQAVLENFQYSVAEVNLEIPADIAHGDVALPIAMQLAKVLQRSPRDIAAVLVPVLQALPQIQSVQIAGPGYINIVFTAEYLLQCVQELEPELAPKPEKTGASPVIVEYSQPNIAKPLGVHHLLSTVVGQAITNLYRYAGTPVIAWNYIGDYGTQFGKLAVAIEKWGNASEVAAYTLNDLLDLYVQFHDAVETDPILEDEARAAFKKLEDKDPAMVAFWEQIVATTKQSLAPLYSRLHVSFTLDLGESFYQNAMGPLLEHGKKAGVFIPGENGAYIVDCNEAETGLPPYLVQKSDGATLYSTRDIAQMQYRIDTYTPAAIYIVTDTAQKLHFEQLVVTCQKLGMSLPLFENILVGRMRFADKSMSTRKGNILRLSELLDEANQRAHEQIRAHGDAVQSDDIDSLAEMMGIGAVSYGILSQSRKGDMVFDWSKFLAFEGNSAPYIQYTYARMQSLLRKAGSFSFSHSSVDQLTQKERSLLSTLIRWPEVLDQARTSHMPHLVCTYLYTLCQIFNSFYSVEPIVQAPEPMRALRLTLVSTAATILKNGANILTISVPDRM
jgi:arginyl-tRNA synthetase